MKNLFLLCLMVIGSAALRAQSLGASASSTLVCAGQTLTLNGSGAPSYTWTSSTGQAVSDNIPFVPVSSATYSVTDGSNTATVSVGVNPLPVVTASATAYVLCAGDAVTLTGHGAVIYSWASDSGTTVLNGIAFEPEDVDTYTVTGTDLNNCAGSTTLSIVVNALPFIEANSSAKEICEGSALTLHGSGATTYTWSGTVQNGVAFVPTLSDTYTLTGTDLNNCVNTAIVSVTVNPLPVVTASATAMVICEGEEVTLNGGGASSYTWSPTVVDSAPFSPTATETYTVVGEDQNECANTATVSITVSPCTGINELNIVAALRLYPNPAQSFFTIEAPGFAGKAHIEIRDNLGRLVHTELLLQDTLQIHQELSPGIYTIRLLQANRIIQTAKLICY